MNRCKWWCFRVYVLMHLYTCPPHMANCPSIKPCIPLLHHSLPTLVKRSGHCTFIPRLLVRLQRTGIVSLSWLSRRRDAKFRNRMSRRPRKRFLGQREGFRNECFSPATFPVTSPPRRPATRVTPESRLVLRSRGCGFCGATTARKQGPLLWRVFSQRASNHDNSPAEKHPSNPCLLARRHN